VALLYLLDTNAVSYAIQGYSAALRERMTSVPHTSMALSVFTEAELLYGLARKPDAKKLRSEVEKFLRDWQILSWDSAAAAAYGDLRAIQERRGRPLSHEDYMIAAHALSLGLTLVTHEQAFSLIDGLKTDDWTLS
jgi:tRNA(fMet)-specific endonuclease VapC